MILAYFGFRSEGIFERRERVTVCVIFGTKPDKVLKKAGLVWFEKS